MPPRFSDMMSKILGNCQVIGRFGKYLGRQADIYNDSRSPRVETAKLESQNALSGSDDAEQRGEGEGREK